MGVVGTATVLAGTRLPTAAYLTGGGGAVVRPGGGIVATAPPNLSGYSVNPQTGQLAAVDSTGYLFIDSQPFVKSPMSIYSLNGPRKFLVQRVRWSPDGRLLAFKVVTPNAMSGTLSFPDTINDGVWVYDPSTGESRQVFRNEYRKDAGIRIAYYFDWTSDSQTLILWLTPDRRNLILKNSSCDINKNPGC